VDMPAPDDEPLAPPDEVIAELQPAADASPSASDSERHDAE
jgi:hypothetical protein